MESKCVPSFDRLTDEDLFKKHRQERRDLQAKIQSLKKTIPKGDKKKKKEITELVAKMEQDLTEQQNKELMSETPAENGFEDDDSVSVQENDVENSNSRVSRARRRREKKEQEDREREKRIQEQAELNREGPRVQETNTIKDSLKTLGLGLHNIAADGNCLYCAVNHQLQTKCKESYNIQKLRKLTADFMRDHKDEFFPFMYNDSDEPVNEEQFEEYCKDVADTKLWGGQLELKALSQLLKCPIKIIQASGPPTLQGENFDGPELVLTYHRHLYRLGEHYNSTTALEETVDEDEGFKAYI